MKSKENLIETEILIIGGGSAGIAAAHHAASLGRQVTMIESYGFLGGMATTAYVGTVCGLFLREHSEKPTWAVEGFPREFAERLAKRSGTQPVQEKKGLWFLPYDRAAFIQVGDENVQSQKIDLYLHTQVTSMRMREGRILEIRAQSGVEEFQVKPKMVIDTTGVALLGHLADDSRLIVEDESYQAGAYVFGLSGITALTQDQLNWSLIKAQKYAIATGRIPDDGAWFSLLPGSMQGDRIELKLSIPFHLSNAISKTKAELYCRQRIQSFVEFLTQELDSFHKCKISNLAPSIGVRTGPRYKGRHILSEDEILSGQKMNNSTIRGTWPIEYWPLGGRVLMKYFDEGDYYNIPDDCLRSEFIHNLFFAGRHISADQFAIASARVIGTCLQMGESAARLAIEKLMLSST